MAALKRIRISECRAPNGRFASCNGRAGTRRSAAKFDTGDRVRVKGLKTWKGVVTSRVYDDFLNAWKYKVREDGGYAKFWNEGSLVRIR